MKKKARVGGLIRMSHEAIAAKAGISLSDVAEGLKCLREVGMVKCLETEYRPKE